MREINAKEQVIIQLGRQGENNAVEVLFDVSGWADLYGAGAFELLNRRPSENTPYTCSITVSDEKVHWIVQSADVALVGHGRCELTYVVNDVIAKSIMFATCVLPSIEGAGTVPAPYESRIEDLIEASATVTVSADAAAASAQEAEKSAETAEAWAVGTRGGTDIPDTDPAYENHAKHYADAAAGSASDADGSASDAADSALAAEAASQAVQDLGVQASTLQAGSQATVQKNVDQETGAVTLNFGIPKGDKGDKGNTGNTGPIGPTPEFSIGTVSTGAAGTPAAATITGTAAAPVLNLTIPKGADGEVSAASMATVYDPTKTYPNVGTPVWYSGQLYKSKVAITTAEAWTAAHWEAEKLAEEVSDLKTALQSGSEEDAIYHLGFYLDENGDLCQVDDE